MAGGLEMRRALTVAINRFIDIVIDEPEIYAFILRSIRTSDKGLLDNALIRTLEGRFQQLAKVLAPDADPDLVHVVAAGTFGFILASVESWRDTRLPEREVLVEHLAAILVPGLRGDRRPARALGGRHRGGATGQGAHGIDDPLGGLEREHVAGAGDHLELGAGDGLGQLAREARRGERVAGADEDPRGHLPMVAPAGRRSIAAMATRNPARAAPAAAAKPSRVRSMWVRVRPLADGAAHHPATDGAAPCPLGAPVAEEALHGSRRQGAAEGARGGRHQHHAPHTRARSRRGAPRRRTGSSCRPSSGRRGRRPGRPRHSRTACRSSPRLLIDGSVSPRVESPWPRWS